MATFGQLVDRVTNKYKGSTASAFTTQAGQSINDAIEYYQTTHFWFTEGVYAGTLTASVPDVTLPSDFSYLHPSGGVMIIQSNSHYPLKKISVANYDQIDTEGTGRPRYFRELNKGLQVYPYPNEAYEYEIRYIKTYTPLSGSQTNDFTTYAPQLIEARALSQLFLGQGQDGKDLRIYWAEEEVRHFDNLMWQTNHRLATGDLQF